MHALRTIRSPPFLRGSKRERSHSNSGEYDPSPDYKPSSTDGSSSQNPRPSRKKSKSGKEDAENEVTVNTALILFVEAVSELIPLLKCDWSPTQEMFVSKFNKAISRARIDGCLRTKAENSIQALVEVKAGSRGSKDEEKIQMQESAEMVSWLFRKPRNLPNLNGYRFLLSQDNDEIYLTFGSCDDGYLDYLKNPRARCHGFLTMQTYGPWRIGKYLEMRHFATVIVALTRLAHNAA